MTPANFRVLNSVLGLNDFAIDAECTDRELADIAIAMARKTGETLDACIQLVSALHATAITLAGANQRPALVHHRSN